MKHSLNSAFVIDGHRNGKEDVLIHVHLFAARVSFGNKEDDPMGFHRYAGSPADRANGGSRTIVCGLMVDRSVVCCINEIRSSRPKPNPASELRLTTTSMFEFYDDVRAADILATNGSDWEAGRSWDKFLEAMQRGEEFQFGTTRYCGLRAICQCEAEEILAP
jgi:hypothetical protein